VILHLFSLRGEILVIRLLGGKKNGLIEGFLMMVKKFHNAWLAFGPCVGINIVLCSWKASFTIKSLIGWIYCGFFSSLS
jgi:hypothetical protein